MKENDVNGLCGRCVYYDVTDEESGYTECTADFDEDEYYRRFISPENNRRKSGGASCACPYFRTRHDLHGTADR